MSRIDDLINELCPDGVEYRALGDLGEWIGGMTPSKSNAAFWTSGDVPWLASMDISNPEKSGIRGRVTATALAETPLRLVPAPSIAVVMRSNILRSRIPVGFVEMDVTLNQDMRALVPAADVDARYAFHLLLSHSERIRASCVRTVGSMAAVESKLFFAWRVPVPPIQVQREIVSVLDRFAEFEAALKAELEAELEARRLQYAHYRDALLSFPEMSGGGGTPLRDIGEFVRGRRFTKEDVVERGIPSIHYGEIYTNYGMFANAAATEVREDIRGRLRFAQRGDVIFAGVGETVEDVGKAVAWLGVQEVAFHDDTFRFRSDLDPKFVAYLAQTADFQRQKDPMVSRAKVKRLSGASLGRIRVPVPPLEEQRRIVAILDAFDALVNDLSSGLPAEIAARRQQYAYYRDRLLTFKEKVA